LVKKRHAPDSKVCAAAHCSPPSRTCRARDLNDERSLVDYGLDSLMGAQLMLDPEEELGLTLDTNALAQDPCISSWVELLGELLEETQAQRSA
jgi:aryl carrier-like protein